MNYQVKVAEPRNTILVDVDCVCADLYDAIALEAALLGYPFSMIRSYDVLSQYNEDVQADLRAAMKEPGFATGMNPVHGAQDGVKALRMLGLHVLFVTSPQKNDHWPIERIHWLQRHFGAKYSDVINSKHKNLIRGLTLIDDHPDHVVSWSLANSGRAAIWYDAGWTTQPMVTGAVTPRAANWSDVTAAVERMLKKRA